MTTSTDRMKARPTAEPVHPDRTHFEVIVVGAGFAGIGAAIKLREAGIDFLVLEKASEIGGVWRDNTYPGCACDVPSALYSYSFAPNPNWSKFFADQAEIRSYTHETAVRFGVTESIRLNHELLRASWNEEAQCWDLQTSSGNYTARFIILACGPMHTPVIPKIRGLETFNGKTFHSARWDHACDLQGRKVAVIGTGASAIQFVPEIQPDVERMTVFQRTPPWVLPKMDFTISEKWKKRFRQFPALQTLLRKLIYWGFEGLNSSLNHPRAIKRLQARATGNIHRSIRDEKLRAALVPDYAIGCKRILQSNTWYRALAQQNVHVVGGVSEIRGDTVMAADGSQCEADVIIFATGFEVANPPVARIIYGASGDSLAERWQGSPEVYLGTMAEDCPNCFLTFGPNLYTFSSAFSIVEAQLQYIMSALEQARSTGIASIAVDPERSAAYNRELQESLKTTVWNAGGCSSYFIDRNGRNSTNWPWTTFYMRKRLQRFDLTEYLIKRNADRTEAKNYALAGS